MRNEPRSALSSQLPPARRLRTWLIVLVVILLAFAVDLRRLAVLPLSEQFQTFVTIFLGIFIEAVPFLLAGSLVSGLIEVFVDHDSLMRIVPRRALPATMVGAAMGMIFPVCECGVVPVTRRLYQKGLPVPVGIAFLLAAPVVNPIVMLSTFAAFGWGPLLIARIFFSFAIALVVGLLFGLAQPEDVLLPRPASLHSHDDHDPTHRQRDRVWSALGFAGDDFLDMVRYLIVGSALAAAMQTLIPQSTLLALGSGTVVSVAVLILAAFVLSICSTVDAFLALSFVNSFSSGSILAFLVFGPMVDIKSTIMFLGVFRRRTVIYLILLPLALSLLIGVYFNTRWAL